VQYALLIKSHANARYTQSIEKLALAELQCMMQAWGMDTAAKIEPIAGANFLTFWAVDMDKQAWRAISRHSAICFAASVEQGLMRPIPLERGGYLPDDIAEVLKYKGKTNADFTMMALHCAIAASDFAKDEKPLAILDPVCGRGTALFCALREGHHAVGVEWNGKDIAEADRYFARYLKYHKMKHRRETGSITMQGAGNAKEIRYFFANDAESYKEGRGKTLRLLTGDTKKADQMLGSKSCHVIAGDLPYGVQHGPGQDGGTKPIQTLLEGAMPAYVKILKPGGAIALSFNTYTLSRQTVEETVRSAGLTVCGFPYSDFSHWVEQAVNRDLVVAKKGN